MARQLPNSFTRYQLSEEEQLKGQILTTENAHFIQNLISDAAESKLAMKFDPNNPLHFAQQEAELTGQIGVLKALLDFSLSAQATLRNSQE